MSTPDAGGTAWYKSSYSGSGGDCLEVATGCHNVTPVRDSKRPQGPVLTFRAATWQHFVDSVRREQV